LKAPEQAAAKYNKAVAHVRAENLSSDDGMVMKRDELNNTDTVTNNINGVIVALAVVAAVTGLLILIRRRRKTYTEK